MSEIDRHPASILEAIADAQPDEQALVRGEVRRSWAEFDDRAARFAAALTAAGVPAHTGVGLLMRNCNEYLEANYGAYKVRAVPININYRYLEEELLHLLEDSNCAALVFHSSLAGQVERLRSRAAGLRLLVAVDDGEGAVEGAIEYEGLLAEHDPAPRIARDPQDPHFFYTGGTTGMPKAVAVEVGSRVSATAVENAVAMMGLDIVPPPAYGPELAAQLRAEGSAVVALPLAPLMHSTAINACAMPALYFGGSVVSLMGRSFAAKEALTVAAEEGATHTAIGGDAMATPLLDELDSAAAAGIPYRLPRLRVMASSGMAWSSRVKEGILRRLEGLCLLEIYGSTEGRAGYRMTRAGDPISTPPTFDFAPGTKLLTDEDTDLPMQPGQIGRIAFPVHMSMHYHGDQRKTDEVFHLIDGVRYAIPGDFGEYADDGSLRPIGRDATVINTGGEKVFSEEVEACIRGIAGVGDCLVIGLPHELWGQQVTALVVTRSNHELDEEAVRQAVRARLAGYKVPKLVAFVPEIPRHANSKADFAKARKLALATLGMPEDGSAGPPLDPAAKEVTNG